MTQTIRIDARGQSPFRALPLWRISTFGFVLNTVWEFAQCSLLYGMWTWSFWRAALWMWAAIVGDVLIVLGVVYATIRITGVRRLLTLNGMGWAGLMTMGFVSGVFLEWIARILDLWDYTALMPTIAVFGHSVGLSPIVQITLLPALSVYLAGRFRRT